MGLVHLIVTIIAGFIGRLLSHEFGASVTPFTCWLVHRAARRLPVPVRERYEAEHLAIIQGEPSHVRKVLHALSFAMLVRESIRACAEYELPLETIQAEAPSVIACVVSSRYTRVAVAVPSDFTAAESDSVVFRHAELEGNFTSRDVINRVISPSVMRDLAGHQRNPHRANLAQFRAPAEGWSIVELAPDGTELRRAPVLSIDGAVKLTFKDVTATLAGGKAVSSIDKILCDARVLSYRVDDLPFMDLILRQGATSPETRTDFDALVQQGKVIIGAEIVLKAPLASC